MDDTTSTEPRDPNLPLPLIPYRKIPRVALMCVTHGQLQAETVMSLLETQQDPRVESTIVIMPNGPYMDMGRNRATEQFVINPALAACDWLLFIDSDVKFTVDDVLAVTQTSHAIVGGAYTSYHNGKPFVVAYNFGPGIHGPNTLLDLDEDDLNAMPPLPTRVDAIGTGFLAIHRSAVDKFQQWYDSPQPWFAELTISPDPTDTTTSDITGIHLGEDLTFCLRAAAIAIPVHIHPLVRLIHFKTVGVQMQPYAANPTILSSTNVQSSP